MNAKARLLVFALFMAGMLGFGTTDLLAAAISSTQSGNWNDASTWGGGPIPDADDDVTIVATHTVTVNGAVEAQSLIVNGTIRPDLSPSRTIDVTGNVTVGANGVVSYNNSTGRLSWTLEDTDINLSAIAGGNAGEQAAVGFYNLTINGTTTVDEGFTVYGDFSTTAAGNFTQSTDGEVMFTNTTEKTISNLGALSFYSMNLSTGTELTSSSDFIVSENLTTAAGSELSTTGFSVLTISGGTITNGGDITIGSDATVALGSGGNVTVTGNIDDISGTVTMAANSLILGSSELSGNGAFQGASGMTLSLQNAAGVAGALQTTTVSLNDATTYTFTAGNSVTGFGGVSVTDLTALNVAGDVTTAEDFTVNGAITVTGSLTATAGTVTTGASANIDNSGGADTDLTFFNLTVDGTAVTSTLQNDGITVAGSLTVGADDVLDMNGQDITMTGTGTITNNNTLTLDGNLNLTGASTNVTLGSNLAITAGGSIILNNANATLDTETFTISTSAAAAQEVTLTAGTVIIGNATGLNAAIDLDAAGQMGIAAGINFTFDGACTDLGFEYDAGEVAAAGGSDGTNINSIGNLTIGGTSAVTLFGTGAGLTVAGDLTVNAGASFDNDDADDAEDFTLSGTGSIVNNGTLAMQALTVSGTYTTSSSFSTGDILTVSGSLVASTPSVITNTNITGGAIASPENTGTLTFYDVIFNGANAFTPGANGDYTVLNDFTLAAASAAYTPGAAGADVTMSGASATIEADGDNLTFGELTVSGTVTADDVITFRDSGILEVSGTFTMSTDALTFGTTAGTINGAGTLNIQDLVCGDALTIAGNLDVVAEGDISGTTLTHSGTGDFTFNDTTTPQTITVANYNPNSMIIPSGADVEIDAGVTTGAGQTPNVDLDGTLDIDAAFTIAGGTMDIASTAVIEFGVAGGASTNITGAGTITASSDASYVWDGAGATGLIGLTSTVSIDGAGATNDLNSIGNATFDAAITSAETFTVNGDLRLTNGNTFAASAGVVTLAGDTKVIDNEAATDGDLTFFSVSVSGSYTFDATSTSGFDYGDGTNGIFTVTAAGSFDGTGQTVISNSTDANTIANLADPADLIFGTLDYDATNAESTDDSFYINEAFNVNAAFTADEGTIFIGGTATITSAAAHTYNNLNVTAAGSATFADGTNGPVVSDSLTVNGTLDVNGSAVADNLTVDGGVISGTGTINLVGLTTATAAVTTTSDITIDGDNEDAMTLGTAFTASSPSTITIETTGVNFTDGGAALTFNNVTFGGAATTNDQDFTVTGDLTVNASSSIVSSAGTITFDGSTDKNIVNNGTLTFFDMDIANTANNNVSTTSSFNIAGTNAASFNIVGTTGGTFSATNGTVSFTGAAGGITNGSDNATRAQFNGLSFSGTTNTVATNDVINVSGDMTFGASTVFTHTAGATGRITLNGTAQQTLTLNNPTTTPSVTFENLTLNNTNGARLNNNGTAIAEGSLVMNRRLLLTSGDLDLNGNNIIRIAQADGRLQETAGNTVVNTGIPSSTGYVAASNAGGANLINTNVGGLGARISTDAAPGAVTVRRYHKPATVGGSESISRYYRITSANASLNSTLTLSYDESELGSIAEGDLLVFNSADVNDGGANPWVNRISTADAANNSFRTRAINTYADSTVFWALAAPNVVTASEVTGTTKGLAASPLTASRDSVVLYGLKLTPAGGEVTLDKLTFNFSRALNAATAEFSNYKLVVSEDNDYTTTSDNTFLTVTPTGGGAGNSSIELDLTTNSTLQEAVDYHYFLVADVATNVTAATSAVTVSMNNFGITLTDGVVKTYSEAGTAYSFIPGYRLDYVSNGVSDAPVVAGQANNVIFGFSIDATSAANFTGFDLDFSSDISNILTNPRVFVSTDASYTTTGDNSAITMASTPTIAEDMITFNFNSAQSINATDKYYFVVADAKGGIDELTDNFMPMLYHDSIITTTAQATNRLTNNPSDVYADKVEGQNYDFVRNTVTVSLTSGGVNAAPPANGNISAGVINQTLLGFTLTSDNNVPATFTNVKANVAFASGAAATNFRDWRLWSDANGNGYGDAGEQIAVGTLTNGTLTFSSYSATQVVSGTSKYIITAEVRTGATVGGTVTLSIPSTSFVTVTSPATVNNGGPFTANTQTIRTPGVATQLALVGDYNRTVITGNTNTFTIQARDANGYPANVSSAINLSMALVNNDGGESTIGGTTTGLISNGRSYTTISPTLSDADGSTVTTVRASDQAAGLTQTSASQAITILEAAPTTDGTITVGNGATASTQAQVQSWTNGNGDGRIIVVRAGKIPFAPTNGTDYTPVTDLRNGYNALNQTGPGSYVIYDGSGASAAFTVSGLTPNTKYYFAIYEYNGSGGVISYKDITFNGGNNPVIHTTATGTFGTIADSTSAALIETDVDVTGSIATSGDKDWYQFNVPSGKNNVMVRLTNLPANYNIELYDRTTGTLQDMTLIRKGESTGSGNETMILNSADAGRYLLKIYGNDSDQFSTSNYTVRVTTNANQLYSLPAGN